MSSPQAKKLKTESGSVAVAQAEAPPPPVENTAAAAEAPPPPSVPILPSADDAKEQTNQEQAEGSTTEATTYQTASLVVEPRLNRRKKNGVPQMSKHDLKWNEMFNRLLQYKTEHQNCLVPQNYKPDPRLGRWVHYQRVEFWLTQTQGSGKITQSRIDKLESIGFEWDPQRAQWNNMFRRLVDFKTHNGHCSVPKGFKADRELANWVRNQRLEHSNFKNGKKSRMTEERKEILDSVGFRWSVKEFTTNTPPPQQAAIVKKEGDDDDNNKS